MTKVVYVPLDGSPRAEAALAPATALAAQTGADLVFLAARPSGAEDHVVERYLDVQVAVSTVPARPWILHDRKPAEAILLAAESDDSMLCMATHGRTGLGEVMLGSVAEAVLRRSVAPIVLVGPGFEPDWHLSESPTVLAGYDGSASARDLAFVAGRLSAELDGRVRLEEVLRPTDLVQTARFPAGHLEALEDLVAELHERGITAQYEITDGFDPADVLVADAVRRNCGLLALGSHGRSGLQRVALGSVTMRVVHRAPCPVLVTGPACHLTPG
jgi:nucleotide-binding universal stress UspA family protein